MDSKLNSNITKILIENDIDMLMKIKSCDLLHFLLDNPSYVKLMRRKLCKMFDDDLIVLLFNNPCEIVIEELCSRREGKSKTVRLAKFLPKNIFF